MSVYSRKPTSTADALPYSPSRADSDLAAFATVQGRDRATVARSGGYYTAVNPTLGTAITLHAAPAIADTDTKSIIHLFNPTTSGVDVVIDYIWMKQTVVNASSTASDYLVYIDKGNVTARASGGTAITPANCLAGGAATVCTVYAGAVVTNATTGTKVAQRTVRPVISVAEDQYFFSFGDKGALPSSQALTGTSVASVVVSFPPVIIPPGGNFKFVQTGPSGASTAATAEFEFGWYER